MKFRMVHENYNVKDLEASMAFYEKALGLTEVRRKTAEDDSFILVYLSNEESDFELELTWLRDHPQPYDLGEVEFHLAFETEDMDAAHRLHEEMGCIVFENHDMGVYFITDPDGYWLEIVPPGEENAGRKEKKKLSDRIEDIGDSISDNVKEAIKDVENDTKNAYQNIEDKVVGTYQKAEDTVVGKYKETEGKVIGGFNKIADGFVGRFLAKDGETVEEARARINAEAAAESKNE